MDVTKKLDAMRSDLPGCALIAFTDLGSKLVLCASAASKPAQEELDRLSNLAQVMLKGSLAEGAAPLLQSDHADTQAGVAMLLSGADAKVFMRASELNEEALVAVCAPNADLQKVVDCGRSTLDGIMAAS